MAGSDPTGSFVADEYRASIRQVFYMALPKEESLRPIFVFPVTGRDYDDADAGGQPFDWTEAPAADSFTPATVTCGLGAGQVVLGIENAGGRGGTQTNETPFGDFDAARKVLKMLDVDYALVAGFTSVIIGGSTYKWQLEDEPTALFDVTWHTIVVEANDLGKAAVPT